ncbi:PhzF family phenazine biosynthesis protein [Variovorax sp. dw_954]|uniref:PhzF family phenazine biosynthesis protein n=1 Tax=Variovorax sp. dw_954 TaxID=2720078 RepID=UPI001BD5B73A|nr:PhzF family phenazine biosynthesis protein [Variovorax sp. dw_954]
MKTRAFQQVDVFTAVAYRGNPVAVVLDGSDLDDAEFQRFAQWTNLSETTFLLPPTEPGADYRIRIFTPGGEMPFAGHPTLGSCRAWLKAGGKPKSTEFIVQQCVTGLVTIRRDGARLAFAAPPLKRTAPSPTMLAKIAHALGLKAAQILTAQQLDNGSDWLGLLLDEVDSVLALVPDHRALKELGVKVGVAAIAQAPSPTQLIARSNREARAFGGSAQGSVDLEVRAFAAATGIEEDPVTGSLNAGLAQWLITDGHMPERYLVGQGQCLGRDGRVSVERDAEGRIWIGGDTVVCIEGAVTL